MTHTIYIEETLYREVEIEAENESDALEKARKMYKDGDIVLDADDFTGVDIELI